MRLIEDHSPETSSVGQIDPHYLIWLAGFFDGEGCISFVNSNGYIQTHVFVTQKDRRILDEICDTFGFGKVYERRGTHLCHQYVLARQTYVRDFLSAIVPYLRVKQEKALEAIEHVNEQIAKRYRKERK